MPFIAPLCIIATLCFVGCSRSPNLVRTYYQLNVSEQTLDQHLQALAATDGVRLVTPVHDSSDKVTLQVYLDSEDPFMAAEKLRKLGYTRVHD
jgi:uncharacterized lipoprotein YmbA